MADSAIPTELLAEFLSLVLNHNYAAASDLLPQLLEFDPENPLLLDYAHMIAPDSPLVILVSESDDDEYNDTDALLIPATPISDNEESSHSEQYDFDIYEDEDDDYDYDEANENLSDS
ncbi:hypothetical protein RCL1_008746 [Eukaryota sp. TZLM3-RCL]